MRIVVYDNQIQVAYQAVRKVVLFILGVTVIALGMTAHSRIGTLETVVDDILKGINQDIVPTIETILDEANSENQTLINNLGLLRNRVVNLELGYQRKVHSIRPMPGVSFLQTHPPTDHDLIRKELDKLILKGEKKPYQIPLIAIDNTQTGSLQNEKVEKEKPEKENYDSIYTDSSIIE